MRAPRDDNNWKDNPLHFEQASVEQNLVKTNVVNWRTLYGEETKPMAATANDVTLSVYCNHDHNYVIIVGPQLCLKPDNALHLIDPFSLFQRLESWCHNVTWCCAIVTSELKILLIFCRMSKLIRRIGHRCGKWYRVLERCILHSRNVVRVKVESPPICAAPLTELDRLSWIILLIFDVGSEWLLPLTGERAWIHNVF